MIRFILVFTFLFTFFFVDKSFGQQDSQYAQYMYNTVVFNSAYTGSRGVLSLLGLHRSQWQGLDGAPITQTFVVHSPIHKQNNLGAGLSVINDRNGPSSELTFNASFSYRVNVFKTGYLSFGLNAGANVLNVDILSLRKFNENDNLLLQDVQNRFNPILGMGVYFRTEKYYAGFSIPNTLETKHFDESSLSDSSISQNVIAKERLNYYFMSGYVFDIAPLIKMKPAMLLKYVEGSPLQLDISSNFLFYNRFTLGASYRLSKAFSGLTAFQISESLAIGFSYDREISELSKSEINTGSYEFFLRFELKKAYTRGRTPRFF